MSWGGGVMYRQNRGFLGQYEYSVWYYNDGYMYYKFAQTHRMYNTTTKPLM